MRLFSSISFVFIVVASRRQSVINGIVSKDATHVAQKGKPDAVIFLDIDGPILPWTSIDEMGEWFEEDNMWAECYDAESDPIKFMPCAEGGEVNPYHAPASALKTIMDQVGSANKQISVVVSSDWRKQQGPLDWLTTEMTARGISILGCTKVIKVERNHTAGRKIRIIDNEDSAFYRASVGGNVAARLVEIHDALSSASSKGEQVGVRPLECCGEHIEDDCPKLQILPETVSWLTIDDLPLGTDKLHNKEEGAPFWPKIQREDVGEWHQKTFTPSHFLRVDSVKGLGEQDVEQALKLLNVK